MNRIYDDPDQTLSLFHCPVKVLTAMELPWRQNAPFLSRIPEGRYPLQIKKPPYTKDWPAGIRLELPDLQRDEVNIESFNWARESQGCIGIGWALQISDPGEGHGMVTSSTSALDYLMRLVEACEAENVPCWLNISDAALYAQVGRGPGWGRSPGP